MSQLFPLRHYIIWTMFAFLLCCFQKTNAQFFNKEVEAQINLEGQGDRAKIVFSAYNRTPLDRSLQYMASVVYRDTVKNRENLVRKDFFVLGDNERKNILEVTIDLEERLRTIIFLLLYDEDGKVIGKDRAVVNGFEGEDQLKPLVLRDNPSKESTAIRNSDPGILRGMMVEETKTKPGRDFYRMLYLDYTANNINGDQIVKVEEVLAIGGNTQIRVYAGSNLVAQFFVNPRATYLQEMSRQSTLRLNRYFEQRRGIQQQRIRY